jgi:hypothetical protein
MAEAGGRPAGAFGRSASDFEDPRDAEMEVAASARKGQPTVFEVKADETDIERAERTVSARWVRFLALGGDDKTPVHEKGVRIHGAVIEGALDFEGCTLSAPLFLLNCELTGMLTLRDAHAQTIDLGGSRCRAIDADRLEVTGSVFMRRGFVAGAPVRLLGAKISGNLVCEHGSFKGHDTLGNALACDGIEIGGAAFLGNGFMAAGIVRMVGAKIGIDVNCAGGSFFAVTAVKLSRASIGGTLWLGAPHRQAATFHGGIDLTGAKVGQIVDGVRASPAQRRSNDRKNPEFLRLDGLTYDRFGEDTDASAPARIAFLDLQPPADLGTSFKPQPWEQVVKVLRDIGHYGEARGVAIEKQVRLRKAGKISGPPIWHWLYGKLSAYGYRPSYLILWALIIAVACAAVFEAGARYGVMTPTDRRIIDEVKNPACRPEHGGNWTQCVFLTDRYTAFDPIVYSIELILPVVSTQQSKDWAVAIVKRCLALNLFGFCAVPAEAGISNAKAAYSPAGLAVWALARAETLVGWIFGLMFVATVSGLIKRD